MIDEFPAWRYGPNGQSGVFECEADVPTGWKNHPSKVTGTVAPRASTKAAQAPAAKKRGRKPKSAPLDL